MGQCQKGCIQVNKWIDSPQCQVQSNPLSIKLQSAQQFLNSMQSLSCLGLDSRYKSTFLVHILYGSVQLSANLC